MTHNEQGFVQVGNSIPSAHTRCSIYKLKFIVCSVAECCSSRWNYSRCLHI